VFDKNAHFCLNALKAAAADEARVVTIAHNDLAALEELCKQHPKVAYVADGVYSTGGQAPVRELLRLQEKYGLFLYFDEAHGISTLGRHGRGLVLEELQGRITDRTIIIASLNKGFGASGGAIFLGPRGSQARKNLALRNGPLMWSQRINTAGLGAIQASAALHRTEEFAGLQKRLQENIDLFDDLVETEQSRDGLPIRFVEIGSEDATVHLAQQLLRHGFYASPIFFPIIGRGRAGLRLMLRANLARTEIETFAGLLKELRDELAPAGASSPAASSQAASSPARGERR
jgi:7-keto-8-aminopelargonate synthetase-like enzyme